MQTDHQKQRTDGRKRRPSIALHIKLSLNYLFEANRMELTDYMLYDDLDGPQRHVTAWHLIRRTSTPLIWWHGLQEVLNGWEQLHRI